MALKSKFIKKPDYKIKFSSYNTYFSQSFQKFNMNLKEEINKTINNNIVKNDDYDINNDDNINENKDTN